MEIYLLICKFINKTMSRRFFLYLLTIIRIGKVCDNVMNRYDMDRSKQEDRLLLTTNL